MEFLTIPQAARKCGVAEFRLRQWVKNNECPGYFAGTRFYVNPEKLMRKIGAYDQHDTEECTEP